MFIYIFSVRIYYQISKQFIRYFRAALFIIPTTLKINDKCRESNSNSL